MKNLLLIFIALFLFSCSSPISNEKVSEKYEDYVDDGREIHPTIEFEEDFYDFGTINHGEVVSYTFSFKNAGNSPLIIKEILAGCGCTQTKVSSRVLRPDEHGSVEVVFNSRGWFGSQYKAVTLVNNSITPRRTVTIKANVI